MVLGPHGPGRVGRRRSFDSRAAPRGGSSSFWPPATIRRRWRFHRPRAFRAHGARTGSACRGPGPPACAFITAGPSFITRGPFGAGRTYGFGVHRRARGEFTGHRPANSPRAIERLGGRMVGSGRPAQPIAVLAAGAPLPDAVVSARGRVRTGEGPAPRRAGLVRQWNPPSTLPSAVIRVRSPAEGPGKARRPAAPLPATHPRSVYTTASSARCSTTASPVCVTPRLAVARWRAWPMTALSRAASSRSVRGRRARRQRPPPP
jgi:hypothetical protein